MSDGSIVPSVDGMTLSSRQGSARPAMVQVTATTSSFDFSLDVPLAFTMSPPGGNDELTMTVSASGNGATSFTDQPLNGPINLKKGISDFTINLDAARTTTPFPSGEYATTVTARCE